MQGPKVRHFNRFSTHFTSSTMMAMCISQYAHQNCGRISFSNITDCKRFTPYTAFVHTMYIDRISCLGASTKNFHKNYTNPFAGNWEFTLCVRVCVFADFFVITHEIHVILTFSIVVAFNFLRRCRSKRTAFTHEIFLFTIY